MVGVIFCLSVGVRVRVILWCVIAKLFLYGKDYYNKTGNQW